MFFKQTSTFQLVSPIDPLQKLLEFFARFPRKTRLDSVWLQVQQYRPIVFGSDAHQVKLLTLSGKLAMP